MATLTNLSTGQSVTVDPADHHAAARAVAGIASATGMHPSDVAADAEMIASSLHFGRTGSVEFADAMNALGLDLGR
jgi:hypothetical protein